MIYSPLEQFQIVNIIPLSILNNDISFTNSSLFLLLAFFLIFVFFFYSLSDSMYIPTKWQSMAELIYDFVLNIVIENVGNRGLRYFPFIFTLFLIILSCNLLGMIPYSFTVTSHIIITFCLSSAVFIGVTLIGLMTHKLHFFTLFLPSGSPLALAPLLLPIEIVSYISRIFSLAIRLFANLMSGHSLLKILAGFGWTMFSIGGIFYLLQFLPVVAVVLITGLEIAIAFLQAYVFTVLTCVYLNESIHLH